MFVSYKESTAPSWLISALIENQIEGVPASLNRGGSMIDHSISKNTVIISSFVHDQNFFGTSLQKLKINPQRYKFIDFFTNFVVQYLNKPKDQILVSLLNSFPDNSNTEEPTTIIIECPELLLFLIPGLTSDELQLNFINPLSKKCGLLIIVSSIESFNNDGTAMDKDSIQLNRFILSCFYKSIAVLSLKPLDTGRARDVTGTLKISKGGKSQEILPLQVVENEYLYHTAKDNTKLFFR
ncbi:hypothetical protein TBLA_0C07170 [Henningerozyma blattae CBS 6284]|uniref:Elongator complex protein 6 n=1 Tax=Henningerozyma blattae (strain ATCC 34711 / CBS 6284 / DSM 70876 / NBRC 10599 / NRRL Y-10934 / UCD 77-7) TaxID=1071380 RepID=I2H2A6_HENB6|nr:hypothetical protein TBLA_0C07170 [Tetrapisispora blattae CBS 6284]CCH60508.1 hypothetical protein TBLA_0C07170 [Tetrapisispora blattae CBS 6284]